MLRFDRGERDEARGASAGSSTPTTRRDQLSLRAAGGGGHRLPATSAPTIRSSSRTRLKAFDEAIAADPDNLDARVRLGELFLEKYNSADARGDARGGARAEPRPPARPAGHGPRARLRRRARRRWSWSSASLEVNPNLAEAPRLPGRAPARPGGLRGRGQEAEQALAENPASLPALSRAGRRALPAGRHAPASRRRAGAALAAQPAERGVLQPPGRAERAQPPLRRGGGLRRSRRWRSTPAPGAGSACSASTSSALGADRGRPQEPGGLVRGRPLQRLDQEHPRPARHVPAIRETQTAALPARSCTARNRRCSRPTWRSWPKRPTQQLAERYRFRPAAPIRIEVYPSHADFSVRTVGLAGLGALGACFGPVLAIDSPSAREIGQFNWGSTLWHELAHTVTLGADRQRGPALARRRPVRARGAPRAARAGVTTSRVEFLRALAGGQAAAARRAEQRLRAARPVPSRSRSRTTRPRWSSSGSRRSAASRPCSACSRPTGDGRTTEQRRSQAVLGTTLEDFDQRRSSRISRSASPRPRSARRGCRSSSQIRELARAGEPAASIPVQQASVREKRSEAVPTSSGRATLFPEYGGDDSPYWLPGRHPQGAGRSRQAADALARLTAHQREPLPGAPRAGRAREDAGRRGRRRRRPRPRRSTSGRSSPAVHERLAALYAAAGRSRGGGARAAIAGRPRPRGQAGGPLPARPGPGGRGRRRRRRAARCCARSSSRRASSARRSCCCACTAKPPRREGASR